MEHCSTAVVATCADVGDEVLGVVLGRAGGRVAAAYDRHGTGLGREDDLVFWFYWTGRHLTRLLLLVLLCWPDSTPPQLLSNLYP